jgi:hypothetical protein
VHRRSWVLAREEPEAAHLVGERLDGDGGGCWRWSRLGAWGRAEPRDVVRISNATSEQIAVASAEDAGWTRDWPLRPLVSPQRRKQQR